MRAKEIVNEADTITVKNIKALLRDHPEAIFHMHDPSTELILYAAKQVDYPEDLLRRFKKKLSDDALVQIVRNNPQTIIDMKNPSEQLQLAAVKADPDIIEYIEKPTLKVQLEVLKQDPSCLRYIEKPHPDVVRLAAEKGYSKYLPHVIELTDAKAQLDAIKANPKAILHIQHIKLPVLKWIFKQDRDDIAVDAISNSSLETIEAAKDEIIKFILRCLKNSSEMSYPYKYRNMKEFLYTGRYSLIKWIIAKGVKWPELDMLAKSISAMKARDLRETVNKYPSEGNV